jgi:hypothetical protein
VGDGGVAGRGCAGVSAARGRPGGPARLGGPEHSTACWMQANKSNINFFESTSICKANLLL